MNEVLKCIFSRRSVKKYQTTEVPSELIEQVVNAGISAASGRNRQPSIVLAVTRKDIRDRLSKINAEILGTSSDPFYSAPVVLVVLAEKSSNTRVYDGSLVMGNMMLVAHSLGLGACWIHRAKETFESEEGQAILKELGIEGDYEGIGNCVIGYGEGEYPKEKPRRENRVFYIK